MGSYRILEIRSEGFLAQKGNEKPIFFPLHPETEAETSKHLINQD